MSSANTPSPEDEELEVAQARPEHAEALLALFERSRHPCFCRYWHHEGDANSWLEQLFQREAENRAQMVAALSSGSAQMSGLVAIAGERVVGWMKLAPAPSLPKLYAQRSVRGLRCFDEPHRDAVFTVACFLVEPEWRELGIARALLAEGILLAQERGAVAIEAFPCTTPDIPPEQLLAGPPSLFLEAGFQEIARVANYPVLRLTL